MSTLPAAPDEATAPSAARHPAYAHLSDTQIVAIGEELDALRARIFAQRGEQDARYIRRVLRLQQVLEVAGRIGIVLFFVHWTAWVLGILLLAGAKVLDNMELGHNIMHGQYDFMNDPRFDSSSYEWDHASASEQWRHTHNVLHHTYTNVLGVDRDIGYGLLRVTSEQFHRPKHWFQPLNVAVLALGFEWAIAIHDLEMNRLLSGRRAFDEKVQDMARVAARKAGRQALKDFVVFPLLFFPVLVPVLLGNLVANLLRNVWTWAVIFCGHFPGEVQMFDEEVVDGESRAEWYLRQMLGSANITGSRTFDLWTGNLNHQVEHHLFPDMPSMRLRDAAVEVRDLCERYDLQYNTGRFSRQLGNVVGRLLKFSLPNPLIQRLGMQL